MTTNNSNLIVIFQQYDDPINTNEKGIECWNEKEIECWNKTDHIDLEAGTYFYRDVITNFYNYFPLDNGSYFVGKPYELGEKIFYKIVEDSNYCISCGVDMGYCNPRQYCCKTYCPNDCSNDCPNDCNEKID